MGQPDSLKSFQFPFHFHVIDSRHGPLWRPTSPLLFLLPLGYESWANTQSQGGIDDRTPADDGMG